MNLIRPVKCMAVGFLVTVMASAVKAGPDKWAFSVDFSQTPDKNLPAWKPGGRGESLIESGKLHLKSSLEDGIAYSISGSSGSAVWDATKPSTIRFKVRVIESLGGETAAHVGIRAENRYFLIPINNREEKTYQFLFTEDGNGRLFIDGVEQGEIKARPMPDKRATNAILFGDLGGSTGGETEWSEFRWTNEGAFEP